MSGSDGVIALVPMRNVVLFPHLLLPITVGRSRSIAAVRHAIETHSPIGLVLQRDAPPSASRTALSTAIRTTSRST